MILGLAAGFAAAMLIGLYVHNEYSFERFISGYEQVYRLETYTPGPGGEAQRTGFSVSTAALQGVEPVTRVRSTWSSWAT